MKLFVAGLPYDLFDEELEEDEEDDIDRGNDQMQNELRN